MNLTNNLSLQVFEKKKLIVSRFFFCFVQVKVFVGSPPILVWNNPFSHPRGLASAASFNRDSVSYRFEAPFIFLYQKFQLRRKDFSEGDGGEGERIC